MASRTTNKSFVLFPGGPFFRLNSWKYVEIKIASSEEVLSPRNNLISKVSDKQKINVRNWEKRKCEDLCVCTAHWKSDPQHKQTISVEHKQKQKQGRKAKHGDLLEHLFHC